MTEAFEKNLSYLKQKETRVQPDMKTLYLFLQALPKEMYVDTILHEIRQLARSSDAYSNSLPYLYLSLGKYIYQKYEVRFAHVKTYIARCTSFASFMNLRTADDCKRLSSTNVRSNV